jgi:hypothetical protein
MGTPASLEHLAVMVELQFEVGVVIPRSGTKLLPKERFTSRETRGEFRHASDACIAFGQRSWKISGSVDFFVR